MIGVHFPFIIAPPHGRVQKTLALCKVCEAREGQQKSQRQLSAGGFADLPKLPWNLHSVTKRHM